MRHSRLAILTACLSMFLDAAPVLSTDGYVSFRKIAAPGTSQVFCSLAGGANTACAGAGALLDFPAMTLTYSTWAQAAPGVLKARSIGSLAGSATETVNSIAIVRADSTFRDQITFYGLPPGTEGAVVFSFVISGFVAGTNLVHLNPGVDFQDTNSAVVGVVGTWYAGGVGHYDPISPLRGPGLQNITIPVTFGQPSDLSFTLQTLLNMRVFADGEYAISDFSSTAILAGMSAYDSNGRPVLDFSATGSGDSSYLDIGPAIPEPGTWSLAAAGLLVVIALRRRS